MNMGVKSSNTMSSSFLPMSTSTATNAANNAAASIATIANNVKENVMNVANSFAKPINDSFLAAKDNSDSPFASMGIVVTLGVCVVLFIIIVVFHQQIVFALELLWHKLKELFGYSPSHAVSKEHPIQKDKDEKENHPHSEHHPSSQHHPSSEKKHRVDNEAVNTMMPGKKEVFNVSQNKYKFSDAEPLCKAFGAELATYDQVKQSWQKGADWCNYGWVKGQSAVYPTQQATYDKLQAGPEEQRNACGVPGVNGGYFDNPEMRFGVNCYGAKPTQNEVDDRALMSQPNLTPGALEYDHKVSDYKAHQTEIAINPFSKGVWGQ